MAEFVTLKKSDGTIIYPQITTDSIANGSITSDKIDWATIAGQPTGFTRDNFDTNGFLKTLIETGDANNITATGFYYLIGVSSNAPDPGSQIYQAIVISNTTQNYVHQIFINVFTDDIYMRKMENGVWYSWRRFAFA